jgi:hypothetical protein
MYMGKNKPVKTGIPLYIFSLGRIWDHETEEVSNQITTYCLLGWPLENPTKPWLPQKRHDENKAEWRGVVKRPSGILLLVTKRSSISLTGFVVSCAIKGIV